MAIETVAMFFVNMGLISNVCFLIGSCWFAMAFVDDIINDVSILNGYVNQVEDAWKLKQQFHFIVQNFADAKQLSIEKN